VPGVAGTPATVIVTIPVQDLVDRVGHATTTDGAILSVPQPLELADQADILPAVLNRSGAVLTLGRTRRIASPAQTHALIARDGGCSFPGCDRPPQWCERHHIVEWAVGGQRHHKSLAKRRKVPTRHHAPAGWSPPMHGSASDRPRRYFVRLFTPF
jgi:hypothetical protein